MNEIRFILGIKANVGKRSFQCVAWEVNVLQLGNARLMGSIIVYP